MKNLTKDLFPVLECEQRYSAGLTLRPVLTFVKNSPHFLRVVIIGKLPNPDKLTY